MAIRTSFNYTPSGALTPRSGHSFCSDNSIVRIDELFGGSILETENQAFFVTGSHARKEAVTRTREVELIRVTRYGPPTDRTSSLNPLDPRVFSPAQNRTAGPIFPPNASPAQEEREIINVNWDSLANHSFCHPASPNNESTPFREPSGIASSHRSPFDQQEYTLGSEESPLIYRKKETRLTIPTRAIDAILIAGDPKIEKEYRREVFSALIRMNSNERRSFEKTFVHPAIKELKDCVNGDKKTPINIETGILSFDQKRNFSTKFVFLRPIQYHLIDFLIHYAHKKEALLERLMNEFPTPIEERIRWMHKANFFPSLSTNDIDEVCKAYRTALLWYELSDRKFREEELQEIQLDPNTLETVARTLLSFIEKTPSPKISHTTPEKELRSASRRSQGATPLHTNPTPNLEDLGNFPLSP